MADFGDLRAAQTRPREAELMIDEATFTYLKKRCPFVALEMERQGFRMPDSCDHPRKGARP